MAGNVVFARRWAATKLAPADSNPVECLPPQSRHEAPAATRIVHLINPVSAKPDSGLARAQSVTFRSIEAARSRAEASGVAVDVWAVGFEEDAEDLPSFVRWVRTLVRSGMDFGHFGVERKLPLLQDVLEAVGDVDGDCLVVYTNIDIALMPSFYVAVAAIAADHEAFVVNRRTILDYPEDTSLGVLEAAVGDPHPGFDCFVFRARLLASVDVGRVVIGVPHVGLTLVLCLAAATRSFRVFRQLHLTYHLGDDRTWLDPAQRDWRDHNRRAFQSVCARLRPDYVLPEPEESMQISESLPVRGTGPN